MPRHQCVGVRKDDRRGRKSEISRLLQQMRHGVQQQVQENQVRVREAGSLWSKGPQAHQEPQREQRAAQEKRRQQRNNARRQGSARRRVNDGSDRCAQRPCCQTWRNPEAQPPSEMTCPTDSEA